MKDIAIVLMVAGISSRFGGKIKGLVKIYKGETLVEYSLNQALKAGFNKIVLIVGSKTINEFKAKIGDNYKGIEVKYLLQDFDEKERDKPWGSTDAVSRLKGVIDCPFVVCNGDDIYGESSFKMLYDYLKNNDDAATVGYRVIDHLPDKGKNNRAVFSIKDNYVQDLNEVFDIEKDKLHEKGLKEDTLISANLFALQPEHLDYIYNAAEEFKIKNRGDRKIECLLPNELGGLIKNGKIKMRIFIGKDKPLGITNPGDEEHVRRELLKRENK